MGNVISDVIMAPTIQSGEQSRRDHRSGHGASEKRGSDLYSCRVKYNNTLPDIPFDPKFIAYPFDMNRCSLTYYVLN